MKQESEIQEFTIVENDLDLAIEAYFKSGRRSISTTCIVTQAARRHFQDETYTSAGGRIYKKEIMWIGVNEFYAARLLKLMYLFDKEIGYYRAGGLRKLREMLPVTLQIKKEYYKLRSDIPYLT